MREDDDDEEEEQQKQRRITNSRWESDRDMKKIEKNHENKKKINA